MALILAGGAIILFFWFWADVGRTRYLLADIEAETRALEEERRMARSSSSVLEERKTETARIRKFFVDRERPVEFIENVEVLARTTGNEIVLGIDEGRKTPGTLAFRFNLGGTPQSVWEYLSLLELAPYQITIEDLSFRRVLGADLRGGSPVGKQGGAELGFIVLVKTE